MSVNDSYAPSGMKEESKKGGRADSTKSPAASNFKARLGGASSKY